MSFQTSLRRALGEIDCASDIVEFSTVVVTRDKQLRNVDHSLFQEKAVVEFQFRFLPSFEESIRAGRSWGYATTCNALSRKAGGQTGQDGCEGIASRVSQLDDVLIGTVGVRAFSLFAASFGRHFKRAECRCGGIRIVQLTQSEAVSLC
ncbi:hypothetical protein [Bradyrhizobium zhanjiangense]|nr:hypothetical protein [Bradyrhizobium zhanjiangense]